MNKLKETNGKYYQECEVVMLDTNDKTAPILSYLNNESLQYFPNTYWSNGDLSKRHLYFLSNKEIKEGDWFINRNDNTIFQVKSKEEGESLNIFIGFNKIIATTDISLRLPQPSKEFIQAFIAAYNEYEPIKWVNVEFEEYATETNYELEIDCSTPLFRLKLNSSNEIIIKKVKDSWTREEVIELLFKCQDEVEYPETYYEPCNREEENIKEFKNDMEEWLEQNL